MKFKIIEPIVQINNTLFVRHKIGSLPNGELIQKCDLCGEVIKDYTIPKNSISMRCINGKWVEAPIETKGMLEGFIFKQKGRNTQSIMHETMGTPKEYIDCTTLNS